MLKELANRRKVQIVAQDAPDVQETQARSYGEVLSSTPNWDPVIGVIVHIMIIITKTELYTVNLGLCNFDNSSRRID